MSRAWRYALGALTVITAIVGVPVRAAAHPPAEQVPDASYYRAEITALTPATTGVTVRVDPGGEWLELSNAGPATVVVLGYTGEPYLRIGTSGAEENQLSQTTYLNRALFADSVPTGQSASSVAPAWKLIGGAGTARWHDHRIHWMGRDRPPVVAADPTHPHLVGNWTVRASADGSPFEVHGALQWLGRAANAGKASPVQAWLLTLLAGLTVVVGMLIIALIRARRRHAAPGLGTVSVDGPTLERVRSSQGGFTSRKR